MKAKFWTKFAIIIAITIPFCANLLVHSYPEGWSDDFRITYGAEKGGAGRDLRFFDIAQDGDYFFVVQDGGRDYAFLTRINNEGIFVVKEKVLMEIAGGPSYVFLDDNRKLHFFYSPSKYPYEIAYLQFDENGNKIIDTTLISEIDQLWSTKIIAGTDSGGNIAIFWLEKNATHHEQSNIMYKKIDNEAQTLINTKSLITIDLGVLDWALNFWVYFDKSGIYFFWREYEYFVHIYYYYFVKFDIDGNILRSKTFLGSQQAQYGENWNYERFLVSSNRIHLFISHTEKKTTLEGKFIEMESHINHTQFQLDGTKISENIIFSEVNGTIFNSLSVTVDTNHRIHLIWDDEVDYGPSTSATGGYSQDQPREIYYLALDEHGDLLGSVTRLTEVDQRNSRNPYLYAKNTDLFLTWSDNRNYIYSDNLNGFDIYLKSTAPVDIEALDVDSPTTTDDYDEQWHNADFQVTLEAIDNLSGVNETYNKINDRPIQNISVHDQPWITTKSANNTLEYWSVDNAGNEEGHNVLTDIKLDKTKPTASAGQNQTVDVNTTVTFDASGSTDDLSGVVSYEWDFGNGATETGIICSHTYTKPDTYTVTLTVKDAAGNSDTDSITVTVTYPGEEFPFWVISTIVGLAIGGIGVGVGIFFWRKLKTTNPNTARNSNF